MKRDISHSLNNPIALKISSEPLQLMSGNAWKCGAQQTTNHPSMLDRATVRPHVWATMVKCWTPRMALMFHAMAKSIAVGILHQPMTTTSLHPIIIAMLRRVQATDTAHGQKLVWGGREGLVQTSWAGTLDTLSATNMMVIWNLCAPCDQWSSYKGNSIWPAMLTGVIHCSES